MHAILILLFAFLFLATVNAAEVLPPVSVSNAPALILASTNPLVWDAMEKLIKVEEMNQNASFTFWVTNTSSSNASIIHTESGEYWRTWITHGKEGTLMPAFAKSEGGILDANQIESLVQFLANTYPSRNGYSSDSFHPPKHNERPRILRCSHWCRLHL